MSEINENSGMYGVIQGYKVCNIERNLELDNRIYARNIPSAPLQPSFSIRPVPTKYELMGIYDRRAPATVPMQKFPTYSVSSTFNPGTAQAPWSGFASHINTESELRNQFFALQNCEQSQFIPSSTSDMYQSDSTLASSNTLPNKFVHLQRQETFEPHNPNTCDLGKGLFMNHTRQQLKDL